MRVCVGSAVFFNLRVSRILHKSVKLDNPTISLGGDVRREMSWLPS